MTTNDEYMKLAFARAREDLYKLCIEGWTEDRNELKKFKGALRVAVEALKEYELVSIGSGTNGMQISPQDCQEFRWYARDALEKISSILDGK